MTIRVKSTFGDVTEVATGSKWTVDDNGYLHVISDQTNTGTVATFSAGTWVSVTKN